MFCFVLTKDLFWRIISLSLPTAFSLMIISSKQKRFAKFIISKWTRCRDKEINLNQSRWGERALTNRWSNDSPDELKRKKNYFYLFIIIIISFFFQEIHSSFLIRGKKNLKMWLRSIIISFNAYQKNKTTEINENPALKKKKKQEKLGLLELGLALLRRSHETLQPRRLSCALRQVTIAVRSIFVL